MPFGIKGSALLFTTQLSMFEGLFTAWKAWNQFVLDVDVIKNEFYHSVEFSGDLVFCLTYFLQLLLAVLNISYLVLQAQQRFSSKS